MHRWDGFNLVDLSTILSLSSPHSVANIEDYRFYLNRKGVFGFGGAKPEIVSNAVERQIYNDAGGGIIGGTFDLAPGVAHKYDYFLSVGTITDDLTDETLNNAILCYDFQLAEWRNYDLAVLPTSWLSYKDENGEEQLIFGDATGQCYTLGGTALTDNGSPISAVIEFLIHGGAPHLDKKWDYSWFFFNPGCVAQVQVAYANTFTRQAKNWITLGQAKDGVVEFKHSGAQSKLMFVKITEASRQARFQYFGSSHSFETEKR